MCGIGGIVSRRHRGEELRAMARAMKLRGPDGEGFFESNLGHYAGLAHRRLSIIDLGTGAQPLANETGNVWVVLNGEIFNHRELRRELEGKGHRFKTLGSDTEVLVHLWEEKGERLVEDLDGMFAFAVLDLRVNRLFLARDRFGIKPLYYTSGEGELRFASTASALMASGVDATLDSEVAGLYLGLQFCPPPRSIFREIRKLPPAHWLSLELASGRQEQRQYWEAEVGGREPEAGELETLRSGLRRAVEAWSLSDVPIACSLSGGLDSSLVLALSSREKMPAYTLRVRDSAPGEDETPLARLMAGQCGADFRLVEVSERDLLDSIGAILDSLDEPYAGGLPSWFIYQAMHRDGIKVCLTGTGGDELFGNYGKFLPFERFRARSAFRLMRMHRHNLSRLRDFYLASSPAELYPVYIHAEEAAALLGTRPALTAERLVEEFWATRTGESPRDIVARFDLSGQLPEEFLFVTDRFSMASSVEARTPFLDHHFASRVLSLRGQDRARAHDPKALLRELAGPLLPPELLRSPKRGFTLPIERWLGEGLREPLEHHMAQSQEARTIVEGWLREGGIRGAYRAWTWLLFRMWCERKGVSA